MTIASVGDTLGGLPVDALNHHLIVIKHYDLDSFCVTTRFIKFPLRYTNALESTIGGGNASS